MVSVNKNNILGRIFGLFRSDAFGLMGAILISASVNADGFPERDIEVVVGFSVGGPTDAAARIVAEEMGQQFGVNVVVNRPGAGGEIAATELLHRDSDGCSLLLATNGLLQSNLPHTRKPVLSQMTLA